MGVFDFIKNKPLKEDYYTSIKTGAGMIYSEAFNYEFHLIKDLEGQGDFDAAQSIIETHNIKECAFESHIMTSALLFKILFEGKNTEKVFGQGQPLNRLLNQVCRLGLTSTDTIEGCHTFSNLGDDDLDIINYFLVRVKDYADLFSSLYTLNEMGITKYEEELEQGTDNGIIDNIAALFYNPFKHYLDIPKTYQGDKYSLCMGCNMAYEFLGSKYYSYNLSLNL